MRKMLLLLIIFIVALSFVSCSNNLGKKSTASPFASGSDEEEDSLILPGISVQSDGDDKQPNGKPSDEEQAKSNIYPPSIFVIEASGSWRQELAPGYYADYECEFYADKLDELYNQSVSGQYTGVFWMKVSLDTMDYLKGLLKDVPVDMQFDAGGEGVCDFFNILLMNGFERQSMGGSYEIPDENGESIIPSDDTLAARGSFTATAKEAYLKVKATGAAGEALEHQDNSSVSTEVDFILHVEPDPDYTATERKVTLFLSTSDGMSATLDGVLRRLPGYSEDLKAYTSQGKRGEILDKHLK